MATRVANVKVACIRPQYQNLKDWMADPNNIYIGRRGIVFIDGVRFPPQDSIFANPYKVGKDGTREEVIAKYRDYIIDKIEAGEIPDKEIENLRGKTLGCWCYPEPCHGDVLVEILNVWDEYIQENPDAITEDALRQYLETQEDTSEEQEKYYSLDEALPEEHPLEGVYFKAKTPHGALLKIHKYSQENNIPYFTGVSQGQPVDELQGFFQDGEMESYQEIDDTLFDWFGGAFGFYIDQFVVK